MPKQQFVDFRAVKQAVSMLQILDHYGLTGQMTRNGNGQSLSGKCPLHNGDKPTQFRVSLAKNVWNCFGQCRGGGNILDFVAHKEDSAIRSPLAAPAGGCYRSRQCRR
jgi:DNA primase